MTTCKSMATLALALVTTGGLAHADGITFDEIAAANDNCCFLSDEYLADMGVEFLTTDDGSVWAGNDNGNPGDWKLNGTNGPHFLGFNGRSYTATVLFDEPVMDFSLDVARANGSSGAVELRYAAFLAGVQVSSGAVPLQGVNNWLTVSVPGEIDEVSFKAAGGPFRPYGIDNLTWSPVPPPEPIDAVIDILPDDETNYVDPASDGVVDVLLLGSSVAAEDVDPDSLAFGPDAAPRAGPDGPVYTDSDADGAIDLIAKFNVQETGLLPGDVELCLTGETFDGVPFDGCDSVTTEAPEPPADPDPPVDGGDPDPPECQGWHCDDGGQDDPWPHHKHRWLKFVLALLWSFSHFFGW